MKYVGFPILGLELNISPVAFNIFGKNVYWYGIIIGFGLIMGALVSLHSAKKENIKPDIILDILIYGVPTAIIFARFYYCIFNLSYYLKNPSEIIAVWNGGIAIYGAIIGAVISTTLYCKIKKLNWKQIFDLGILGVITGQAIGRWGNFVNVEAYGKVTQLPWRMNIVEAGKIISVHPTFLYESLWNILGLFILLYINKHKRSNGDTFFSYLIWYGIGRAIIEGLRTDSLYIGMFRVSQIVGIITALIGIFYFILKTRTKKDSNS